MAHHFSILACSIPWTASYRPQGIKELGATEATQHIKHKLLLNIHTYPMWKCVSTEINKDQDGIGGDNI